MNTKPLPTNPNYLKKYMEMSDNELMHALMKLKCSQLSKLCIDNGISYTIGVMKGDEITPLRITFDKLEKAKKLVDVVMRKQPNFPLLGYCTWDIVWDDSVDSENGLDTKIKLASPINIVNLLFNHLRDNFIRYDNSMKMFIREGWCKNIVYTIGDMIRLTKEQGYLPFNIGTTQSITVEEINDQIQLEEELSVVFGADIRTKNFWKVN